MCSHFNRSSFLKTEMTLISPSVHYILNMSSSILNNMPFIFFSCFIPPLQFISLYCRRYVVQILKKSGSRLSEQLLVVNFLFNMQPGGLRFREYSCSSVLHVYSFVFVYLYFRGCYTKELCNLSEVSTLLQMLSPITICNCYFILVFYFPKYQVFSFLYLFHLLFFNFLHNSINFHDHTVNS